MAITVEDILLMDEFKDCKLLTGKRNLNNIVSTVTVIEAPMDQQYMESVKEIKQYGYPGDFNISALYAYKNDEEGMLDLVKTLITEESAALCIMDAYMSDLPERVASYAEDQGFPIMIVPREITYANLISKIMEMVIKDQKDIVTELRIKALVDPLTPKSNIREIAKSINGRFEENGAVITLKLVEATKTTPTLFWDFLKNKKRYSMVKLDDMYLCILTFKDDDAGKIKDMMDIAVNRLMEYSFVESIGVSSLKYSLDLLPKAISESGQALEYADISNENLVFYDHLGVNQLLIPLKNDEAVIEFSNRILTAINQCDSSKHKMMETVRIYVKNKCNIVNTAEEMKLHENSVRYRLEKLKDVFNPAMSMQELNELLSLAVKISHLRK
jgi:sugar diacid utilization regulator